MWPKWLRGALQLANADEYEPHRNYTGVVPEKPFAPERVEQNHGNRREKQRDNKELFHDNLP